MQRYEIILNASCIIHNFFVPLIDINVDFVSEKLK